MADGFVHTVHRDGAWANTIEGEDEPLPGTFQTKEAAVIAGRDEAMKRKTEHWSTSRTARSATAAPTAQTRPTDRVDR